MLRLDWASYDAAKYACARWHYLSRMPRSKCVRIGAWEDGEFIGVAIFSPGATPTLYKTYGLSQQQGCELTRVALRAHKAPVSKILSIALRMLKSVCPGLALVISFADTGRGHHGGIYQATNWLYVGDAVSRKLPMLAGRLVHERTLSGMVKGGELRRDECSWIPAPKKHKYLMPLTPKMRERVSPLAKPYPSKV